MSLGAIAMRQTQRENQPKCVGATEPSQYAVTLLL